MNKLIIKGAILIFSCYKHYNSRFLNPKFGLKNKEYQGWKVFYFLGNPNITSEYEVHDEFIILNCEDSYIHVMKKVILGIKYVFDNFIVQEGILRCGDDIIFNELNLINFINKVDKKDYMGYITNNIIDDKIKKIQDNFMISYFSIRKEELLNPLNGLKNIDISNCNQVPQLKYISGVIFYLSTKSCEYLIQAIKNIKYDIFYYDTEYGYPYIIEDIGVGFILKNNHIYPTLYDMYTNDINSFNSKKFIGLHTNYDK